MLGIETKSEEPTSSKGQSSCARSGRVNPGIGASKKRSKWAYKSCSEQSAVGNDILRIENVFQGV